MELSVRRNIGDILLDGGFIANHDLKSALEEQKHSKELLGQALIRMGVITTDDISATLVVQEHLDNIDNAVKIAAGERQLLGSLVVQSGLITNDQLDHVITKQLGNGERLGDAFKRLGLLTEHQLRALLDFQHNQELTNASPLRLGELLVTTGHLTRERLDDALYQQTQSNKKLGEVLVDKGYVSHKQINKSIHLQQMLIKTVLAAIISIGMGVGNQIVDNANAATGEMCLLSKQIQSSPMRELYASKMAIERNTLLAYNSVSDTQIKSDVSENYFSDTSSTKSSFSSSRGDRIDSFSIDCLSCHDGGHARDVNINFRNNLGINKIKSYDGTGQHPIGMDYAAYYRNNPSDYKPVNAFNSKMIFVNGKVGCLTCHNPMNPEKNHLVMSDTHSALCLTCHKK